MKIMCVITGLGHGGAENLLLDIMIEQASRGIEQTLVYLTPKTDLLERFENTDAEVHFIDKEKLGAFGTIKAIKKLVKTWKPDVVHTHLVMADTLGRAACLFVRNVKIFSTVHNMDEWMKSKKLSHRILRLFNRVTVNRFKKNRLIAVAECCREHCIRYEKIKPNKITTLYNFITPHPEKRLLPIIREDLGISQNDLVFVNVGRMEAQKAQMDILMAAKSLKEQNIQNVQFIIIGDGSLRPELKGYIEQNSLYDSVKLTGVIQNVYNYFEISNLFIMSSLHEGFSIAILEAFDNKLPVLSSSIPSVHEMIEHGKSGILYEAGNIDELVNTIKEIKNGRYNLPLLAENAHAFSSELTKENYMERLFALYRSAE